jgi:hypothetical protein
MAMRDDFLHRRPPTLMFTPTLATVTGQPSTGTQCAAGDFLGTLQFKYD